MEYEQGLIYPGNRGGPKKITAIDSQRISEGDLIFRIPGGKTGQYKVDLLADLKGLKEVEPIMGDFTKKNLDLIRGDVVCVEIAGETPSLPQQQS